MESHLCIQAAQGLSAAPFKHGNVVSEQVIFPLSHANTTTTAI